MENIFTWTEFNESYNKPRVGGFSQKQYCKRKRKGGHYKSND